VVPPSVPSLSVDPRVWACAGLKEDITFNRTYRICLPSESEIGTRKSRCTKARVTYNDRFRRRHCDARVAKRCSGGTAINPAKLLNSSVGRVDLSPLYGTTVRPPSWKKDGLSKPQVAVSQYW